MIKVYCIRFSGMSISASVFKYISEVALIMFSKERKRMKHSRDDVKLHLTTKFETVCNGGIAGYEFQVHIDTPKGETTARMIARIDQLEQVLDDNFEMIRIDAEKSLPEPSLN
jgi:hypothetical protein